MEMLCLSKKTNVKIMENNYMITHIGSILEIVLLVIKMQNIYRKMRKITWAIYCHNLKVYYREQ